MDYFGVSAELIALILAIFVLAIDLTWQVYWAGYVGPDNAKKKIIDALKNPQTAEEIRVSLDLPNSKAISDRFKRVELRSARILEQLENLEGLNEKIQNIEKRSGRVCRMVGESHTVMKEEFQKAQDNISKGIDLSFDEAELQAAIARSVKGYFARMDQLQGQEFEQILSEFEGSPEGEEYKIMMYQYLCDMGIPEPAVRFAVQRGPNAVRAIASQIEPLALAMQTYRELKGEG